MNLALSVTTIMSQNLLTIKGRDPVGKAKAIFDSYNVHHLPVVHFRTIKGILSKADLNHFLKGSVRGDNNGILEESRLRSWKVEEIMNEEVVTLTAENSISDALDIFKLNKVHCLPILENDQLIGILTPHDFILSLAKAKDNQHYRNFKVA